MTSDLEVVGRRAVACTGWEWRRGMRDQWGRLFLAHVGDGVAAMAPVGAGDVGADLVQLRDIYPDFSDGGTRGLALDVVRDAWRRHMNWAPGAVCCARQVMHAYRVIGWVVGAVTGYHGEGIDIVTNWRAAERAPGGPCASEAEAIVVALENAAALDGGAR